MAARHRAAKSVTNVYRGYMPLDLPQHRKRPRVKPWWKVEGRPRVTLYPKPEIEGYSEEAEYPPLNDGSKKGCRDQVRLDWYESLKKLPTVDAKMWEINRHCMHNMAHINNWLPAYNALPMAQYLTQTHLIRSLPDNYRIAPSPPDGDESGVDSHIKEVITATKRIVLDQIRLEHYESQRGPPDYVSKIIRDGNREAYVSNRFIQNLVSRLRTQLALETNPQLLDYQTDLSPALRSWWYHSGFEPPKDKLFYESRKDDQGRINQMVQMHGSAAMCFRADSSIEPVISQTDHLVQDTSLVQDFCYPLRMYGAEYKFKWPVTLPGFWYGDEPQFDFPHTCFLSTDCLKIRESKNYKTIKPMDDVQECLEAQAILTAFGWLNGLSMYHGYTPFQEIDYPLTCQLITTNGQDWLFNVYQMNAHTFHRDLAGPKKNNLCWTSGVMRLYENYNDGEFTGVNEQVFKTIIRFLAQKTSPEYTSQLSLRPFLGVDDRSDEVKAILRKRLRKTITGSRDQWLTHQGRVPLFEHIYFRSPEGRYRLKHMKPKWHPPIPKCPKIFE